MIQLQHLDANGTNLGVLYVRPEEIAALYADYSRPLGDSRCSTFLVLRCGTEFRLAQSIAEALNLVQEADNRRGCGR